MDNDTLIKRTFNISGLSCQGCVNKVRKALAEQDHNSVIEGFPKDNRIEIMSKLSESKIQAIVESVGYHFHGLVPETITYEVHGMSCQGCVSKVRKAIQIEDEKAEVEGHPKENALIVKSDLSAAQVQHIVESVGYEFINHSSWSALNPQEISSVTDEESAADNTPANSPKHQTYKQPELSEDVTDYQLALSGITCAGCVNTIHKALSAVPEVKQVDINFASRTAQISTSGDINALIEAVEQAGYGAEQILDLTKAQSERAHKERLEFFQKRRFALAGLGLGIPLMAWGLLGGSMGVHNSSDQIIWGTVGVLCLLVMIYSGKHFYSSAWRAFKHRHSNMDTLIALGTGSAWLYSMVIVFLPDLIPMASRHLYFEASTMILGLINLGQALEVRARGKTSEALQRLLDLQPKNADVMRDGQFVQLDISSIQTGDRIRVKAGERLPVDGLLYEGQAVLDESMLTGEPIPVSKSIGDTVSSGSINGNSSFTYTATKVGSETLLAQIITMVGKAQNSKPPISQLADKVSAVFVPSVVIIAIFAALIWFNFGPEPIAVNMLVAAVSVLIIACPCALGLATPISTMIGVGKAAEYGGLIRNGDALQKASEITTIVLDKTGTITEGKPSVSKAHYFHLEEAKAKSIIYALEKGANHPLANALLSYSTSQSSELTVTMFEAVTGQGVQGKIGGELYLLGNESLMQHHGITLDQSSLKTETGSRIYLANSKQLLAEYLVQDRIKPSSQEAIKHLQAQGIRVIMLTGDNLETATAVAKQVGIVDFKAAMRPEDKLTQIRTLQSSGAIVGMIGDGTNDAPALAQADVGFAMGGGTDVAMESADITLVSNDLNSIANVIAVSKATLSNIKQNLWGAFGYNALGIPIAAGLLYPITGWLLSPVVAGAAMSLSSITVVLNANRLRLYKAFDKSSLERKREVQNDNLN